VRIKAADKTERRDGIGETAYKRYHFAHYCALGNELTLAIHITTHA